MTGTGAPWPTVNRQVAHDLAKDIAEAPIHGDETIYERRMQSLSLRNAGHTISGIAKLMKVSTATVRNDIEWAKREVMSASMEDIIATQRAIIHDLRHAAYPAAMNHRDGENQARAQGRIIDGLVHEAKLVGAFAPMRTVGAPTDVEFAQRFVDLISAIQPETLKELTRGHFAAHPTIDAEHDGTPAGSAQRSGHVEADPLDADVVELPEPPNTDPAASTVDVAKLGQCRCGKAHCGGEHELPEPAGDGDDWSNIG